mgnify:CR=1 FL=1
MKWIGYISSSLWRLWFFLVFLTTFILFIPPLFLYTAIIKNNITICTLNRYWSRMMLLFSGLFYEITYEEKLSPDKIYIFCPNHTSTLDIPLMAAVIPFPLLFMGKAELVKIPIFGYFFKQNSIVVDRKNRRDAYSAFLNAGKKIDKGMNVCIFPEGGIPKGNIFLKKFKNGPFRLAIEKGIEIIPVSIIDNKYKFPQEYYKGSPGKIRVTIHKAIKPNKNVLENLNNNTYNIIFDELKKYESR